MTARQRPIIFHADSLAYLILPPEGQALDPKQAIAEAKRRNVFVEGLKKYYGSGTRLGGRYVLTARHVVKDILLKDKKSKIFVNGVEARLVRWSKKPDLALLEVKDRHFPPIRMRTGLVQLMPAFWCGNPLTNRHFCGSCTIMGWRGSKIFVTGVVPTGASGGGLYTLSGEFTGMITRDEGFIEIDGAMPYAVSASRIMKFLESDMSFLAATG